jgi:hypothetical protein
MITRFQSYSLNIFPLFIVRISVIKQLLKLLLFDKSISLFSSEEFELNFQGFFNNCPIPSNIGFFYF